MSFAHLRHVFNWKMELFPKYKISAFNWDIFFIIIFFLQQCDFRFETYAISNIKQIPSILTK